MRGYTMKPNMIPERRERADALQKKPLILMRRQYRSPGANPQKRGMGSSRVPDLPGAQGPCIRSADLLLSMRRPTTGMRSDLTAQTGPYSRMYWLALSRGLSKHPTSQLPGQLRPRSIASVGGRLLLGPSDSIPSPCFIGQLLVGSTTEHHDAASGVNRASPYTRTNRRRETPCCPVPPPRVGKYRAVLAPNEQHLVR